MPSIPVVTFRIEEAMHPVVPEELRRYSGWIFSRAPVRCCAVRAQASGTIVHAISGLPRPDVAAAFPDEASAGFSGFRIATAGVRGQSGVLEWMDQDCRWHEFWREPAGDNVKRPVKTPRAFLPRCLLPALRAAVASETKELSLRDAWKRTRELAAEFTSQTTPESPNPDLLVNLDLPGGELFPGRLLPVNGWIFHRRLVIRRLFARVEPEGLVHLAFPLPRPDVVAAFPNDGSTVRCGFEGMILLPAKPSVWFNLQIYAETADGSVSLAVSRRLLRWTKTENAVWHDRATVLLAGAGVAAAYRPESWSHYLRELFLSRSESASTPSSPAPPSILIKPPYPDPAQAPFALVEPREHDPLISILVPVYNTPERYLREMIASVQGQSYPRWELCLADDASTEPHVRRLLAEFSRANRRIRPVYRAENGHISRASNSALAHATGEFVALLDHDDLLAPDVLLRVVESLRANPQARFLYTNRDKIDDEGRHFDAENRGAWNPAAAITHNYLHHLTVIQRSVVLEAGAFRPDYFGSQDLDLYLRCHELLQPDQIIHVPCIGYHWRAHAGSTASRGDQKDYMFDSARRGIEDALRRRGLHAKPFLPDFGTIYGMNLHQLRWDPDILHDHPVSIVVAVPHSRRDLWPQCLAQLVATTPVGSAQIIVVLDESSIVEHSNSANVDLELVVAPADAPLAERFNLGAARACHPLLLLLDAGVAPKETGWLEDLAGWLSVPGVAAAGPKLIAADGRLRSAGWTVHPETGVPQAVSVGDPVGEIIPPYLSLSARDALLLDSACLLTHAATFRKLEGYDSRRFPTRHFAADYCVRLRNLGPRIVFSPQAVLHTAQEMAPRQFSSASEDSAFQQKHPQCRDPWILPPAALRGTPSAPNQAEQSPERWMPADTVEFSGGWFYLEQPFTGEEIHSGHQVLSGWCLARLGTTVAELRANCGEQIHLVDFGHPRPDLAKKVGFTGSFFPIGFHLELALGSGPARLEFEGYVVGRGWMPICTIELNVLATRAKSRPAPVPAMTAKHFVDVQELLLKQSVNEPALTLLHHAQIIARQAATLTSRRYAAQPFRGFINSPTPNVIPMYGGVIVSGWLFHETQAIRRLAASFELTDWLELQHQRPSPSVSERFPGFPAAVRCDLFGYVTVPPDLPQPLALKIWAELEDGSWHLAFLLRTQIHSLGPADLRLLWGAPRRTLWQTAVALQWALFRERVCGPGWLELGTLVAETRRRLPAPLRQTSCISLPTRPAPARPASPHLILVSHNLNREGAPLFLLELARFCLKRVVTELTVFSPSEGSLRADFETLGAEVRVVDRTALWSAQTPADSERAIESYGRAMRIGTASLVIANTVECFWAVSAANRSGRPSLFYIHEPGVLGFHYLEQIASHLRQAAALALTEATCVSFTNQATQAYYLAYTTGANARLQPGWTDQTAFATQPDQSSRTRSRARLGIASPERVVINVGTLCPRKGQLFFIRAVELLWRTHPAVAARCRFLLIGAHDNDYGTAVAALIAQLGRPNLKMVAPTREIQDYFSAADLFVLSSFEEGFSRVLLEAMGCGLPIVSTSIHGIPEISRHEREALLVPPGDVPAMAKAMQQLLQNDAWAAQLGRNARARLECTFTAARVLPGHLATITELARDLKAVVPEIPAPGLPESICAVS